MAPSATSSSEDEDMTKIIEAADSSMYKKYLKTENEGCKGQVLPSLRNVEEDEGIHVHKGLNVTPAFQSHVAHHLTKLLDSQLLLDDNNKDGVSMPNDSDDVTVRKIARARRILAPSRFSPSEEQVPTTVTALKSQQSNSGVRLFGASAVFLSNLDITPANAHRRPKRGRKFAQFSSGSESSGAESGSSSDSNDVEKFSAAAVSPDWVLSGAATKGWACKEGKVERCFVNQAGILVPFSAKEGHCTYSTTNVNINNNEKEVLSDSAKDDLFALQSKKKNKKKKRRALSLDGDSPSLDGDTLAASFNAAVCISADSPCDHPVDSQRKKNKRRKKDHNSEDATTETTEVEDVGEDRKKKRKKRKKQKKKARKEERAAAEVPELLEEEEDEGIIIKHSPLRKKKKRSKKHKGKVHHEPCRKVCRYKYPTHILKKFAHYSKLMGSLVEEKSGPTS